MEVIKMSISHVNIILQENGHRNVRVVVDPVRNSGREGNKVEIGNRL